jgi:hypothetical protein
VWVGTQQTHRTFCNWLGLCRMLLQWNVTACRVMQPSEAAHYHLFLCLAL